MDFTAGMRGINLGHNHPKVLFAIAKQMEEYSQSAGFFKCQNRWKNIPGVLDFLDVKNRSTNYGNPF